jgi:hypothetical protein
MRTLYLKPRLARTLPRDCCVGTPEEIVSDWELVKRDHPQGAPVALALLPDGSILGTEDLKGTLLRIASSGAKP